MTICKTKYEKETTRCSSFLKHNTFTYYAMGPYILQAYNVNVNRRGSFSGRNGTIDLDGSRPVFRNASLITAARCLQSL